MQRLFATLALVAAAAAASAQEVRYEIGFPDLPGFVTLACDLHQHTVFSDGEVWPTVRVREAWRQGLDAISITDHLEYQPHKADIPTKHNRPYELANGRAAERAMMLIRGSEITRDTPPGHFNAVFLKDNTVVAVDDFVKSLEQANGQGAFVFWNHQGWQGEEKGRWLEIHTTLFQRKLFQGMEIANGDEYYPEAHRWCLEKNLAMLGSSDIHAPDLRTRSDSADHRTLTLVFARRRDAAAVKEALLEGRTAVWYKDQILGRPEWLERLFAASVTVEPAHFRTKEATWTTIRNRGPADLLLERVGKLGPAALKLPARSVTLFRFGASKPGEAVAFDYAVTNYRVAPATALRTKLVVPAGDAPKPAGQKKEPVPAAAG